MLLRNVLAVAGLASIASVATAAAHDAVATHNFTYSWAMRNATVSPSNATDMITQTQAGCQYTKNHSSPSKLYLPLYFIQSSPTFTFSAKDIKSLSFAIDNNEHLSPNQVLFNIYTSGGKNGW